MNLLRKEKKNGDIIKRIVLLQQRVNRKDRYRLELYQCI